MRIEIWPSCCACRSTRAGARNLPWRTSKIQLDQDAVGIGHEDLMDARTRHLVLAEFEAMAAQRGARRFEIASTEGDVIERRGVAAAVRAVARLGLLGIDQMHD